ncbi:MAG: phosphoribosylaminoimidazolesuccinocarboxamide synthase [Proteobacteria bacterium]|nr:phosphoribosylaminoimidazolesuccinocarboxamide synthase [Pseudomonadota bacterium]
MIESKLIEQQLNFTLKEIDLPNLGKKIPGKVRDSYVVGDKRVLITSDRISAFDKILSTIPFKGQVLNQMASYWFKETADIVPNHIIDIPHPNVFISKQVKIIPVEVVVRGYLAGSAWRDYQAGNPVSGITLKQGLKKSQRFDTPIITPSTKEEFGKHDMPISTTDVVAKGIVDKAIWDKVCEYALALFNFGSKRANENGLILVDTKYEFGVLKTPNGSLEIILADEIHTSDCSRYWMLDSYQECFNNGIDPIMLDKEFVRRWLMERGYMGEGNAPEFTNEIRIETAEKYIQAYEKITGKNFTAKVGNIEAEIKELLKSFSE